MPLSVSEGIATGVEQVATAWATSHGAKVIKVSGSGGIISHSTGPGAQQYSDEDLAAIADETHRAGIRARGGRQSGARLRRGPGSTAPRTASSPGTRRSS
jgi:hypothetical protein